RPRRRPPARHQARRPGGQAQQRRGARPLRIVRVPRGSPTPWLLLRHRGGRARDGGKPGRRGDAQRGPRGEPPAALSGLRDYVDMRLALFLAVSLLFAPRLATAQASPAEVARGKYVFGATGGCGCHTVPKQPANAGGRRYDGPFGTVYSTNITPDRETGIGSWTDEQIITAIRLGRRPNGERLIPVHPYTTFNGMIADDLQALVAFLRTVPAVKQANQPKKISVPMFESVFLPAWLAAFAPKETPPTSAPTSGTARGEYLVRAVGHCGECNTPRTMPMAADKSRFLAGKE